MSNGHHSSCDGCIRCQEDACPEIAYCVNERPTGNLCEHHVDAVCSDHWPGACPDCRLEAEREMYISGEYDPHADPFFLGECPELDVAAWLAEVDAKAKARGFDPATNSYTNHGRTA